MGAERESSGRPGGEAGGGRGADEAEMSGADRRDADVTEEQRRVPERRGVAEGGAEEAGQRRGGSEERRSEGGCKERAGQRSCVMKVLLVRCTQADGQQVCHHRQAAV